MHNVHFIKVQADSCEEAINECNYNINIENTAVDYFQVIGSFSIEKPHNFITINTEWFEGLLGTEPAKYIEQVLNVVNSRVRPLEIVKAELIAQVQAITSMNYDNHHGAWRMKYLAEELAGCYYITDLIKQQKYAETWEEVGLTNLYGSDDDKTHLVLIDFHS